MKAAPIGTEKTPSTSSDAAGVLLFHHGSILLAQRCTKDIDGAPTPYGGYWSPFGGALEKGESPRAAAVRELWEESQLEISVDKLIYITSVPRGSSKFYLYAYELRDSFSPRLDGEHSQYGYFPLDSLDVTPSPLCPQILEAIRRYADILRFS